MPRLRAALVCVIAAAAVACGSNPAAPGSAAPPRRAVVLGDSLAVSPSPDQSFPAQLQTRADRAGLRWTVTNAGVIGDTTADGLRRLPSLLADDVAVLVVELGANDGLRGIPVATIEANLSAIISTGRNRNLRMLLCGMETLPLYGADYALAFHAVFPRTAQQYALPLVPFLLSGVALMPELNGPDGLHPNAAGAARIAETVWPYLEPLLRQG
jgi:acyl-CoA thioesterase-1